MSEPAFGKEAIQILLDHGFQPPLPITALTQAHHKAVQEARNVPMGVSEWRAHGKKYGYWKYFEAELSDKEEK